MELPSPLLLIFVHGNNGAASDWDPLIKVMRGSQCGELQRGNYMCFSTHQGRRTLVGVEALAVGLVQEVCEFIAVREDLAGAASIRLYVFAHSLGGLVSRMVSPHLGVVRPGGTSMFSAKSLWKWGIDTVCRNLYQQTGSDLVYASMDTHAHTLEETLLFRLSDPQGIYMRALSQFRYRTLVSSPFYDMLVPYCTSAMVSHHPYDEAELEPKEGDDDCLVLGYSHLFGAKYESLLKPFARPGAAGRADPPSLAAEHSGDNGQWQHDRHLFSKWPRQVIENLSSLEFRRLDVQLKVASRWLTHDSYLKKPMLRVADSGDAGDNFHFLLSGIVALDLEEG